MPRAQRRTVPLCVLYPPRWHGHISAPPVNVVTNLKCQGNQPAKKKRWQAAPQAMGSIKIACMSPSNRLLRELPLNPTQGYHKMWKEFRLSLNALKCTRWNEIKSLSTKHQRKHNWKNIIKRCKMHCLHMKCADRTQVQHNVTVELQQANKTWRTHTLAEEGRKTARNLPNTMTKQEHSVSYSDTVMIIKCWLVLS